MEGRLPACCRAGARQAAAAGTGGSSQCGGELEQLGPALGYPHTSAIQAAVGLRELRPRRGRSPWRGLYRQVGEVFVIAAVGPEAEHDPRGFRWACEAAVERLDELEEE